MKTAMTRKGKDGKYRVDGGWCLDAAKYPLFVLWAKHRVNAAASQLEDEEMSINEDLLWIPKKLSNLSSVSK
jgi:hypothetical protein